LSFLLYIKGLLINYKLVLILFAISVIIRIPNIDRPISKHHEFNVAFFLIPMEIWEKEGVKTHCYIPPYSYFGENDKNITSPIGVQAGIKNGTNYYLSFPSFSYLLPYFIFQCLHLEISALNLQIFNLSMHLILILFLYKTLLLIFRKKNAALIGSALYLFAPGPLWFHGNAYTHHVLSVLFLVLTLYYAVKLSQAQKSKKTDYIYLAISLTCLLFTEWIGFLLVFTIGIIVLLKRFRNRSFNKAFLFMIIISLIVFGALYIQYNSFIGWDNYIAYLSNRFEVRSTITNDETSIISQIINLFKWYIISYGVWLALIAILLVLYFKKLDIVHTANKHWSTIMLFTLPIILYHFIFMGFTMSHDYSVLIDGIPMSLLCAFLVSKVDFFTLHSLKFIGVLIVLSAGQYYFINRPGEFNHNGDRYDVYLKIGESIRENAKLDETIFIKGCNYDIPATNPQIMFYAKRNFVAVERKADAISFLKKHNRTRGIIFTLHKSEISEIIRLRLDLK